jgi:hypothetical protein
MEILQLVYLSHATEAFNYDSDIDAILDHANRFNKEQAITGMLLFRGGVFLQLLEGPKEAVQNLYGKIATDNRHTSLKLLVKQNTTERLFENWSMAFTSIDDIDYKKMSELIDWDEMSRKVVVEEGISNPEILDVFKTFRFKIGK